jgi:hypothetical protein
VAIEVLFSRPALGAGIELEEGMPRKIGLSVAVVSLFIAIIVGIGLQFNSDGLNATGGLAMVGVVVCFVLAMAGVGVALAD